MREAIYIGVIFFSSIIIVSFSIIALVYLLTIFGTTVPAHVARIVGAIVMVLIISIGVSILWYWGHKK